MEVVLSLLERLEAPLDLTFVQMGKASYEAGHPTGIEPAAHASIESTGVLLKGPMETPTGKGYKSINVTARKRWSAYANKRVFRALPNVETPYSRSGKRIDIVLVRENIEDTYGAIEHMLTHDVALCRRFITRPGSLQVHRYAFELARRMGRKRLTCGHKANIMKLTDGLFLETFREVARDFPDIESNDLIVDDMAMKLVTKPESFDMVVLPNLQGDILSDLCAGLVGGLGFAPSANVGDHVSIFEAVHGSAPDIAGKGLANPCALIMSAAMMLRHVGLLAHGDALDAALARALAAGARTADFGDPQTPVLSTREFGARIASEIDGSPAPGAEPTRNEPSRAHEVRLMATPKPTSKTLAGADYFVESDLGPAALADVLSPHVPAGCRLTMISNRGTQVWPTGSTLTDCVNQYRVRVESEGSVQLTNLLKIAEAFNPNARICSIETLLLIDGKAAFSLAQGQG